MCYVHNNPRKKDKFGPRSKRCLFVRYPHSIVYDLEEEKLFDSRDVVFYEQIFSFLNHKKQTESSDSNRHPNPLPRPMIEHRKMIKLKKSTTKTRYCKLFEKKDNLEGVHERWPD